MTGVSNLHIQQSIGSGLLPLRVLTRVATLLLSSFARFPNWAVAIATAKLLAPNLEDFMLLPNPRKRSHHASTPLNITCAAAKFLLV
ncbi:MAG: hypothetical protein KME40_05090 [Komarekiella atlantica HA4396-MV6]|nr:hypothetical protein [Komarekiella atlantica HA4396-MV6]